MALHDILEAIKHAADERIARARADHQASLEQRRSEIGHMRDEKIAFLRDECERKKKNMERQVVAHAQMSGRQAEMTIKHALLEQTYDEALDQLASLDAAKTETLLRRLLEACPDGGTIRPALPHAAILKKLIGNRTIGEPVQSRGGFVYVSDILDRNCTYEILVHDILRPATELHVAELLFSSPSA